MLCDDALDDGLQDQRIAADIPARLEAEAGMRAADRRDGIDIIRVELRRGDQLPMLDLAPLGALDMRLAGKEPCRLGRGTRLAVEGVERAVERGGDCRQRPQQRLALAGVEIDEPEAFIQLLRLGILR